MNDIAANALAPCVARPSVVLLLNMWDKWVLVVQEYEFKFTYLNYLGSDDGSSPVRHQAII